MAAPVLPPRLRDGDRLTRDEFLSRWEGMPDLKFAELIDGIVYMASPVSNTHCDYHFRLSYWLGSYIAATPGCKAGIAGTWLMSEDSAPQPDLALEIDPKFGGQSRIDGDYPAGAPGDELDQQDCHCNHQQNVNESTERIRCHQSEEPQD